MVSEVVADIASRLGQREQHPRIEGGSHGGKKVRIRIPKRTNLEVFAGDRAKAVGSIDIRCFDHGCGAPGRLTFGAPIRMDGQLRQNRGAAKSAAGRYFLGFHFCKVAKLLSTWRSRAIKSGQRLVRLRMETAVDTEALVAIILLAEKKVELKHGKGPRGLIVRQLQQTLFSGK